MKIDKNILLHFQKIDDLYFMDKKVIRIQEIINCKHTSEYIYYNTIFELENGETFTSLSIISLKQYNEYKQKFRKDKLNRIFEWE